MIPRLTLLITPVKDHDIVLTESVGHDARVNADAWQVYLQQAAHA